MPLFALWLRWLMGARPGLTQAASNKNNSCWFPLCLEVFNWPTTLHARSAKTRRESSHLFLCFGWIAFVCFGVCCCFNSAMRSAFLDSGNPTFCHSSCNSVALSFMGALFFLSCGYGVASYFDLRHFSHILEINGLVHSHHIHWINVVPSPCKTRFWLKIWVEIASELHCFCFDLHFRPVNVSLSGT